jgi:hypothetical protein
MRKDKEKAIELRHQGKSYKQICKELGTAKSTLAEWFKNEMWSQEIKARLSVQVSLKNPKNLELLAQANRERWESKYKEYRTIAVKEFQKHKKNPLFLTGIMLYWGKGEKQQKSNVVKLSNSEPEMIKIFNLFLIKVLKISPDRISAWLLLYPDLVDSIQKNLWSKATGLSLNQFKKSIYIKGKHPKKRLSYGVCTIFLNNRALKEKILKWLELYQDYLKSYALTLEN